MAWRARASSRGSTPVRCAVGVQRGMARAQCRAMPPNSEIGFRTSASTSANIIIDGGGIYNDGVNIAAARLEALAEPGGISHRA